MAVLGIVAEYDPFHNGHFYHLRESARIVSPSAVIVALSGPVKQRGAFSLLSPFARAECALSAGADAVFALPVCWTVRDAEHYALGAVSLLASLGATHLAFGAETADLPLLRKTADLLESSPESLRCALRGALSEGLGYPSALAHAAGICLPESRPLLSRPNNILAVCYLRALHRLSLPLEPVVVPRAGSYHAEQISSAAPSASALREALLRGSWPDALSALPPFSRRIVRNAFLSGEIPDPRRLDALLLEKLRSMAPADFGCLPDCPEGLDRALRKAAVSSDSQEELISLLTTRRYPSARLSRLCACALLGITREDLEETPSPSIFPGALLLGVKKNPSLTGLWKNHSLFAPSAAVWRETAPPADLAAWRLWGLAAGLPASFPFNRRTVTPE